MATSQTLLSVDDLVDVLDVLKRCGFPETRWYDLGLRLGLLKRTLDIIEKNHPRDVSRCMTECLSQWLGRADNVDSRGGANLDSLSDALRSMNETAVAEKLKHHVLINIFNNHTVLMSQSLCDPVSIAWLLYVEGTRMLTQEAVSRVVSASPSIPNQREALLTAVKKAVQTDPNSLHTFANVLCTINTNVSLGQAILDDISKYFPTPKVPKTNKDHDVIPQDNTSTFKTKTIPNAQSGEQRSRLLMIFCYIILFTCIVSTAKEPSDQTIGDKSYSEEAQANATITIDWYDISGDLLLVAKSLQLAENGLVSIPVFQGEVKKSQIQFLKLTDKSQVAISDFGTVSSKVIDNLEAMHDCLYNGSIEMAKRYYASIAKEVEEMPKTARTLSIECHQQVLKKIEGLLSETYEKKEAKMKEKMDLEAEKTKLTLGIMKLEAFKKELDRKSLTIESLFNEAKQREREAIKKDESVFMKCVNAIVTMFVRPETLEYFEKMEKVRDDKSALEAEIAELTQNMSKISDMQKLADEAIEFLHNVISGLINGISNFTIVAIFWDEMSGHLRDLQSHEQLKYALFIGNEKERKIIIKSHIFKKAYDKYFAKWNATRHQMTKVFPQKLKPVRDKVANIVRQNLNQEESRKNMKKISEELLAEEARRRKRIKTMKRNEPQDEL